MSIADFNMLTMCNAWNENQDMIQTYLSDPETFSLKEDIDKEAAILGVSVPVFIFILIIQLIIFVWSVYALTKYWNRLPQWVQIVGIVGLIFGLPIITLVAVYAGKK
jgi:hypothetical protein